MDVMVAARARRRRKRTIRTILLVIIAFLVLLFVSMINEGTLGDNGGKTNIGKIGIIKVSDRQNGGAIVDNMVFEGTTDPENNDFNSLCTIATGEIVNIGTTAVDTVISLVGTTVSDDRIKNSGLNIFPYYYKNGETNPLDGDAKAYFARHDGEFDISSAGRGNGEVTLYRLDKIFKPLLRIDAGEKYELGVLMWLDETAETDAESRKSSSVTIKIISRASET